MQASNLSGNRFTSSAKKYAASVLLQNTPSVLHRDGVIPNQINQKQNAVAKTNLAKQTVNSVPSKIKSCLSLQSMQKMIERFINEKQMSIKQLAEKIGVSPNKLSQLNSATYSALAAEINLPLIKLYCKTKWD